VARLERRMDERDEERDRFRQTWSARDIEELRRMLNGWIASAAVKAFWGSFVGKAVILGVALIQAATFAMALLNTYTLHHP